jgi:hypothetical protein
MAGRNAARPLIPGVSAVGPKRASPVIKLRFRAFRLFRGRFRFDVIINASAATIAC